MAKQKAKASTQEHLDIDDIVNDMVIMKNGWVALVMSTTAVNFDLLSEAEQDATIYAYGAFLNSLTFPIEILVRSKKADITSYFASLEEAENSQPNPDLKRQIQKYKDFIQSTVQQKTVLDKKFYIIINFSPLELGLRGITSKKTGNPKSKTQLIEDAKNTLMPKRDHIIKQTSRLGLITKQLTAQELIELFYDIYNPAPTGTQRVILDNSSYTTPIVEPALEVPAPAPTEQLIVNSSPASRGEQFTENNHSNSQPVKPTPEPSTVNREPITELRPVPPPSPNPASQPTQPTVSNPQFAQPNQPTPSQPNPLPTTYYQTPTTNLPAHQVNTLKGLQEATARAAQIVNRPTLAQQPNNPITQPASLASGQPNNLKP